MVAIEKPILSPDSYYHFPKDVLDDDELTTAQKKQALQQWELDAREIMTADEENMAGDSANMLHRVLEALHTLDNSI